MEGRFIFVLHNEHTHEGGYSMITHLGTEEIVVNINVLSEVFKYLTECDKDTAFVRALALNQIVTNINKQSTLEVMDLMKKADPLNVAAYLALAQEACDFEMPTISTLVDEEISQLEFEQLEYTFKEGGTNE